MHAWSFLGLKDEDRHYSGNDGYSDTFGHVYHFDSTVANSGSVSVGDLIVIRDSKYALGFGWIERVDSSPGVKTRRRCVSCGSSKIARRKTSNPAYRCQSCNAEFDDPDEETVVVNQYWAYYSSSFIPVDGVVQVSELDAIYESHAKQQAIRRMNLNALWRFAVSRLGLPDAMLTMAPEALKAVTSGFRAGNASLSLRERRARVELMEAYGPKCVLTGLQAPAALEIAEFSAAATSSAESPRGLLLRRDLHGYLGRFLIAVNPDTWRAWVSPSLLGKPDLAALNERELDVSSAQRPEHERVAEHFALATEIARS